MAAPAKQDVIAVKKGRVVLDHGLPDELKSSCHVLEIGDTIYDAMLNQTNISSNNNKYYAMQVLESDDRTAYYTFARWGRVGSSASNLSKHDTTEPAVREFERKFLDKTKNHWSNRHNFVSQPGKYTLLEMDYEDSSESKDVAESNTSTKLDARVHRLISLVCDLNMMKQEMTEIGYNAQKMPLGKLSKATILKGYEALKKIAAQLELSSPDAELLRQLSNEFYTIIPHNFGHRSIRDQTIRTKEQLKSKLEMVEALGEIQVATKILKSGNEDDPAYAQYKRLKCELDPLNTDTEEYEMIESYLMNTHGHTHSGYKLEICQAFKVSRAGEDERFQPFKDNHNRMLLWHGSRLSNWTGILSQGLRIAPPEAPSTGYMFGKGVYFADMVSKSANYCNASASKNAAVMLLCEVALGDMNELLHWNYNASALPPGKLSTKGLGRTVPHKSEFKQLSDGLIVPMGKPLTSGAYHQGSLEYNEYIVYNTAQVRMRYLLQVSEGEAITIVRMPEAQWTVHRGSKKDDPDGPFSSRWEDDEFSVNRKRPIEIFSGKGHEALVAGGGAFSVIFASKNEAGNLSRSSGSSGKGKHGHGVSNVILVYVLPPYKQRRVRTTKETYEVLSLGVMKYDEAWRLSFAAALELYSCKLVANSTELTANGSRLSGRQPNLTTL
ncbi:poly [ADP-ribose] polymerase 2 [Selaginella moellendorffii]|uniref:poly [ADP-ribose] polymerase 2 n=1 Tax=Selaginella moellendorffii TaxID=88036 RepID=UPI000D1CC07D|nr:poly [ADP-ribose] polymerase 2 [Selaginella moellendorffii]|eukprot:XP_024519805.1 poly [ADP-ribose] polymerase 2 [Selaginella moellendorffii]